MPRQVSKTVLISIAAKNAVFASTDQGKHWQLAQRPLIEKVKQSGFFLQLKQTQTGELWLWSDDGPMPIQLFADGGKSAEPLPLPESFVKAWQRQAGLANQRYRKLARFVVVHSANQVTVWHTEMPDILIKNPVYASAAVTLTRKDNVWHAGKVRQVNDLNILSIIQAGNDKVYALIRHHKGQTKLAKLHNGNWQEIALPDPFWPISSSNRLLNFGAAGDVLFVKVFSRYYLPGQHISNRLQTARVLYFSYDDGASWQKLNTEHIFSYLGADNERNRLYVRGYLDGNGYQEAVYALDFSKDK